MPEATRYARPILAYHTYRNRRHENWLTHGESYKEKIIQHRHFSLHLCLDSKWSDHSIFVTWREGQITLSTSTLRHGVASSHRLDAQRRGPRAHDMSH